MNTKQFAISSLAATVLTVGAVGSANATLINFDQNQANNPSGTISYDGNGGDLVGSNISFTYVNVDDGRSLECTNRCFLNFNTGSNISEGDSYSFNGGGDFSLSGELTDTSTGQTFGSADSDLLSGTFVGTQSGSKTRGSSFSFIGNGDNDLSDDFLAYLGLDESTMFEFMNSTFSFGQTSYDANGGFSGKLTAADLNVRDVPEPGELAMFGMGLVLLGGGLFARRRLG